MALHNKTLEKLNKVALQGIIVATWKDFEKSKVIHLWIKRTI